MDTPREEIHTSLECRFLPPHYMCWEDAHGLIRWEADEKEDEETASPRCPLCGEDEEMGHVYIDSPEPGVACIKGHGWRPATLPEGEAKAGAESSSDSSSAP